MAAVSCLRIVLPKSPPHPLYAAKSPKDHCKLKSLYYPLAAQPGDGGWIVAKFLENLIGVLAQAWRAVANGKRRARQPDRFLQHRDGLVGARIVHGMEEVGLAHMRVVERLLRRVDRPGGNTVGFELAQRLCNGA